MAAQKRSGGVVSQLGPGGTAEEALGPWVGPPDGLEAGRGVAAQGRPEARCLVAGSGGGGSHFTPDRSRLMLDTVSTPATGGGPGPVVWGSAPGHYPVLGG